MPSSFGDLDRLVPRLRAGEEAAFTALYERLVDQLATFAHGQLRDKAAAEDVVQEAFLQFVRNAESFDGDGRQVASWLYRAVRNKCIDRSRSAASRYEADVEVLPSDGELEPPASAALMEATFDPVVAAALDSLTEEQRSVLLLREIDGLDYAEIAEVLGTTRRAAYSAASRARSAMRAALSAAENPASEHRSAP